MGSRSKCRVEWINRYSLNDHERPPSWLVLPRRVSKARKFRRINRRR